jgi:hypothetical protein
MSSSISSSDPWKRFFRLIAGTAAIGVGLVYAFVVLIDPFGSLPLSLPLPRVPVANNQRFAYPALARLPRFDSAVFGTSTSRLLRPSVLDPIFGARFANLAMNDATVYEQTQLFGVFARAHPGTKALIVGLDYRWCVTGPDYQRLTFRAFPQWMYGHNRWAGYREMLNLYAIQSAGQLFGILIGVKQPDQGLDGFTSFVPPDDTYDHARAQQHLVTSIPAVPVGTRDGPPATWTYPAMEPLRAMLATLPPSAHKLLFFVPYNQHALTAPGTEGQAVWDGCRDRVVALARAIPNTLVVDFMFPSPITTDDDNYWDYGHTRIGAADRIAHDFAAAERGDKSADYKVLWPPATE